MAEWNVDRNWALHQSNGAVVSLSLVQAGTNISSGTASHSNVSSQSVTGSVNGDFLFLSIDWNNSTFGEYHGRFSPDGRLSGITFDVQNPGSQATWAADKRFTKNA
ncbi:MAG: hypothetical protein H0V24_02540 [Chloroflexia bacterium]|nr:hypothetical protein [Chloroflexia bacterium]